MTRIEELAKKLSPKGLDAIMIGANSRINRRYLYNFGSSGGTFIVKSTGESWLIIDGRYSEIAAERAKEQGYTLIVANTDASLKEANEVCKKAGIKTLGYEAHLTPVSQYESLKDLFAAELKPSGSLVEEMRESKTEYEAGKIEEAQRIAEEAFDKILGFIKPGLTEKEVSRELTIELYKGGCEALSFPVFCLSGPNSSRPHGVPGERRIQKGDFVMLDFGAVKDGYYSDMTRTVAVGSVTDEMRFVYETVLEAQKIGIRHAIPGKTCHEVDATARDYITRQGYGKEFAHLLGHGLGLTVAEAPFVDAGVESVLREGTVTTIEPGIYLPGRFGVRIEDMVWLAPVGTRNLTRSPKELIIL